MARAGPTREVKTINRDKILVMIVFRSIIAGLGFVLITVIAVPIAICTYLSRGTSDSEFIGFDVTRAAKAPEVWLILSLAFSVGFFLQYRHLKSKVRKNSN